MAAALPRLPVNTALMTIYSLNGSASGSAKARPGIPTATQIPEKSLTYSFTSSDSPPAGITASYPCCRASGHRLPRPASSWRYHSA